MEIINSVYLALCIISTLLYVFLLGMYLIGWLIIPVYKSNQTKQNTKLCVLISARNEEKNIVALLDSLQNQHYPKHLYEVIVVDDHSEDSTVELVNKHKLQNLTLLHLKNYVTKNEIAFKKRAIELAVSQTDAELIINTDADCTMSADWLSEINSFYESTNAQFIVAPVDYFPINTLLKKLQELDFLGIMVSTAASVRFKQFNLSNGANMAYTKKAFLEVNGYEGKDQSPSGDDVFLIEKIGAKYPNQIGYLKSHKAMVNTKPCDSLQELFQQRVRWISKTRYYTDWRTKAIGYCFGLFYVTLLVNFLSLPFSMQFRDVLISQIIVKLVIDFLVLLSATNFYGHKKLLWLFPFFELVHFPFTLFVGLLGQFIPYKWKNRTINGTNS